MRSDDFMDAVGKIGDGLVEKYAAAAPEAKKGVRLSKRIWFAAAAVLVLLVGAGIGGFAYAEEAKEFKEASVFFDENGLSSEGLTRAEIRRVYRDITTESFSYSKTAEVIAHDMRTNSIPGWEILTEDASPREVHDLWEAVSEYYRNSTLYCADWTNNEREENGAVIVSPKDSTLQKRVGDKVVWTYRTTEMRFYFGQKSSDGVLGIGVVKEEFTMPSGNEAPREPTKPAITKLTNNGERVWFVTWDNGALEQQISSVVEEADGSFTVISQNRDREKGEFAVCVTRVSKDGEYLGSKVNPTENDLWVCDAVSFNEGHAAVGYDQGDFGQSIVLFDKEGNLTDEFEYSPEGRKYRVNSVAVLEGKLYISANMAGTPSLYSMDVPIGDVTEAAKQSCTAVLLVCGRIGGEPAVFYEVGGAMSFNVKAEDGRLIWTVDRIISADKKSMFGLSVVCFTERAEYRFYPDGSLEGMEKLGEFQMGIAQ